MAVISAGLLMYRMRSGPEILLAHYGGPYWIKKDKGAWGIPKGQAESGEKSLEDLLQVAKREFEEETSFEPRGDFEYLTTIERSDGKKVHVWVFEGDADLSKFKSNTIVMEWPPRSGRKIEIPEVDKGAFFRLEEAKEKIIPYQLGILATFEEWIKKKVV
ncbi:hypothetical protein A2852_02745 [Candidatus Adlerbacteria bacterium RIFCSPHIGHO2_01_FULL_54_23]|nr:MAG: NUDIX hydrolase [Candidatus Adlerbacteria bacterium GW2011_GWA1_54_10]OGC79511.1 MAG: hypothetical protein A2852_02745 [Candidatus Adlerbacteria bacterium RIFCSPHIGHO2_01_FULL_54_23]OGC87159.1 MAG: hypothetical protein A3B33_01105 [Candidatus Adlerbacteria bacterium RIFCSPLOWO2_01_FULL_54_16]